MPVTFTDFLNIYGPNTSQGSMATYTRCGGILNNHFAANLLENLPVEEFWKPVKMWQNCDREFGVQFFWPTLYILSSYGISLEYIFLYVACVPRDAYAYKNKAVIEFKLIRYDTRCYFNVRSKADISRLNMLHGNNN